MKNRVRVSATFSFRGETHHPEMVLDLDHFLDEGHTLDELYPMLAAANGIGAYSYEYEVLEMAPLHFDQAEGLAADFVTDGRLDLEGLRAAFQEASRRSSLESIARQKMGVDKLEEIPGLEAALQAAWELGRQS
ncbi:MAG TPA: hypothetical protein ENJ98_02255 [Thiolapillus brandeum]|uniref:Uncharacterized protein n=1 Tax=Thiolapillus brandeum TaxID=1076588 RepID=A0A7C5IYP3_9GAMM|nr:hypothetical protein [Thiolapillus brandeum]